MAWISILYLNSLNLFSYIEEANGKGPTRVVNPKLDPPTEDTSGVPAVPTCHPKKSVEQCGECKNTAECISGFCCPYMKRCVANSHTPCPGRSWRSARCNPACRKDDPWKCKCGNSRFPDKWGRDKNGKISEKVKPFIGLPTCEGNLVLQNYVW